MFEPNQMDSQLPQETDPRELDRWESEGGSAVSLEAEEGPYAS